jgi:hypothetical protein
MHNYFILVTETHHRHSEHERKLEAVANTALAARTNGSRPWSVRRVLALARFVLLERLSILAAPWPRISLNADRARS